MIFTGSKLQGRFQRQGLLGALLLHLAFPIALTAPQWWPMMANKDRAAMGSEHDQKHETVNAASRPDEASGPGMPLSAQRSQLRIIVAPGVAAAEPVTDRKAMEESKPNPDRQTEPLPDQPVALQQDDGEQAAASPDQQAIIQAQASITAQTEPTDQATLVKQVNPSTESPANARKVELEAELRALSERIQAYQRQQDKEQAERAATVQGAPETQASHAQAAPAVESASREAMIHARLPVQLKALRGQWNYKMYYGEKADDSVVALVRFEVEVTDSLYVLRSLARPQGLAAVLFQGDFTQESRGAVSEWGYQPSYYEEHRGQRGKRWAQMDWEQGEVRLSDGARLPIARGVQDRLSIAWQLSALARSQLTRLQSPSGIQIPLILTRNIELNRFFARAMTEELIDGQRIRLLKVEREPRPGKRDASIEVWLDMDRDMLPVRLRIEDRRGRVVEQVLQKESW